MRNSFKDLSRLGWPKRNDHKSIICVYFPFSFADFQILLPVRYFRTIYIFCCFLFLTFFLFVNAIRVLLPLLLCLAVTKSVMSWIFLCIIDY